MDNHVSRREFVGSIGAAGAMVGTAGCSGVLGGDPGIRVAGLVVDSAFDEAHTIRVEIYRDGDRVFQETFELADSDDYVVREASWSTDPATYTVYTAVFGPAVDGDINIWGEFDGSASDDDADCVAHTVLAAPTGATPTSVGQRAAEHWNLTCG